MELIRHEYTLEWIGTNVTFLLGLFGALALVMLRVLLVRDSRNLTLSLILTLNFTRSRCGSCSPLSATRAVCHSGLEPRTSRPQTALPLTRSGLALYRCLGRLQPEHSAPHREHRRGAGQAHTGGPPTILTEYEYTCCYEPT